MGRTLHGIAEPPHPWLTPRHPISRDRTAHQQRPTLKGRDQEGHHDSEKREGCRVGQGTNRSHQSRYRHSCQHAIQPLHQDLREGGGTGLVERRNHHQGDLRDCSNNRGIMLLSTPSKVLNRILLERMKEAVDPKLRDQQAGFRRNKSCADQIASLRINVEQSLEWNSLHYIDFKDYKKAFDNVDREKMWMLLRHYGVPEKIISLIRCTCQDRSCKAAYAGLLSESFEVKTGVRQGCLLSPFLFLLVIDWILKITTTGRSIGIQWTLWTQLDNLDFADTWRSCHTITARCRQDHSPGDHIGRDRVQDRSEEDRADEDEHTPVTVGGEPIRDVESFVYLGSMVDHKGGTDWDVLASISKTRACSKISEHLEESAWEPNPTPSMWSQSCFFYRCETWRATQTMQWKNQTFFSTCLRRVYKIQWQEKIQNEDLWEREGQEPVAKQILWRKWGWIGHTLKKPASSTIRQALTWNPLGKRKRGRPRNSWRRDTEAELKQQGTNWTGIAREAQGSDSWNRPVISRNYAVVANFKVRNYRLQKIQIHETDPEPYYLVATYTKLLSRDLHACAKFKWGNPTRCTCVIVC